MLLASRLFIFNTAKRLCSFRDFRSSPEYAKVDEKI